MVVALIYIFVELRVGFEGLMGDMALSNIFDFEAGLLLDFFGQIDDVKVYLPDLLGVFLYDLSELDRLICASGLAVLIDLIELSCQWLLCGHNL